MDQSIFISCLLLLVLPILISVLYKTFGYGQTPSLPPGPRPWPIIGNLHQIGRNAHISLTQFSKTYGPLISLKLGSQLLVVASSPSTAAEILKTHDRILSGRYILKLSLPETRKLSLLFSPQCDDNWKSLRSVCRSSLFAAKTIESQAGLRRKKMGEMVEYLISKQGEAVNLKEIIFNTAFNTISNLIFSRDLLAFEGEIFSGFKENLQKMMALGLVPNLADFYPVFENFDLQCLKKKLILYVKEITFPFTTIMDERRKGCRDKDDSDRDFLDILIENRFSDDQIYLLIIELFTAGTDTTTTTVEWAMAELMANKEKMFKVRAEIEREMKEDAIVDEAKLSQFHYIQACVKETLRLHPPAPFLLPREASEECQVLGYRIPKETRIFINVWAIGRDPKIWEEASAFKPERFMGSEEKFRVGQNYEFLPFGGGRRLCPGMGMASAQVPLFIATLIQSFDWLLPDGEDPSRLDYLNGKLGVAMQKEHPLLLIPKLKNPPRKTQIIA